MLSIFFIYMYLRVYVLFTYMLETTVTCVHQYNTDQASTHSGGTGLARYRWERERGEGHGQLITQLLL